MSFEKHIQKINSAKIAESKNIIVIIVGLLNM